MRTCGHHGGLRLNTTAAAVAGLGIHRHSHALWLLAGSLRAAAPTQKISPPSFIHTRQQTGRCKQGISCYSSNKSTTRVDQPHIRHPHTQHTLTSNRSQLAPKLAAKHLPDSTMLLHRPLTHQRGNHCSPLSCTSLVPAPLLSPAAASQLVPLVRVQVAPLAAAAAAASPRDAADHVEGHGHSN